MCEHKETKKKFYSLKQICKMEGIPFEKRYSDPYLQKTYEQEQGKYVIECKDCGDIIKEYWK